MGSRGRHRAGGGGGHGRAGPGVTRRIRGGPAGGKGGQKGRFAAPGVGLAQGRSGRASAGAGEGAAASPAPRRGVRENGEKGDEKAKMKVKNQRKRVLGVKGGAGRAGPGGRRGPSAVRAGKGMGLRWLPEKGWLALKTSLGSCVLGPWGINLDSGILLCSGV